MTCSIQNSSNPLAWIATVKDVALVVLSATAILFGYIQSKRSIRTEWIKGLRQEIAKFISTASRISVSEVEFRRESTESIALINLFLSDENKLHNELFTNIKALEVLWLAHRLGQRKDEHIENFVQKVDISAKAVLKAEGKKIF